ncbi:YebF family protein [Pseudocitrobacter cyperus]|uniref:YebF family protein n=1 Tax=Pseudocitrobacter cyperus TaxID=3112843 RepID=A0ABV0HPA3_9ENTR
MRKALPKTLRVPMMLSLAVGTLFILLPTRQSESASECRSSLSRQAKYLVQEDYLKSRFPYWQIEKKMLGTLTPDLSFGRVTIENEAYHVPFTAVGPDATLTRVGIIDCRLQDIDYAFAS